MEYDSAGFPLMQNQVNKIEAKYSGHGAQAPIGKVRVHKSGKVTMTLPGGHFELLEGINQYFKSQVLKFNDEKLTAVEVGRVAKNFVCSLNN